MAKFNFKDFYLRILYWFVSYKKEFKKWWIIAITTLDILMIVYVATSILIYISETPRYNKMIVSLSENFINNEYRIQSQPKEITIEETRAIPISLNKYDLVAKIKNSNKNWGIKKFKYRFILDGTEKEEKESFILPDEEKYLFHFGVNYSGTKPPQKVEVKLSDIEWQRISDKKVINNLAFESSNIKFTSSTVTNTNQPSGASHLTANIKNKSIYDFWEVGVPVILIYNNKVVGINYTTLRKFISFEEQPIDVSWLYSIPENSEILIKTEVNIFDLENFM
jgi:hypothetical protein